MTENVIERISEALGSEKTLEGFVRQLLEMLELVTDMESTYLTRIDSEGLKQHILYSRNSQQMQIPEGLSVPWQDTLCKRAMDSGQRYTCDVASIWGDSEAAKALGITTYVSTPVRLGDGELYGTLCAASTQSRELTTRAEQVLQLFAELIAQYIRKEQLLEELREANAALRTASFTDELTGLPNRRSVFSQLTSLFARAKRDSRCVLIAFADLDGFKQINDRYGHKTGDAFLIAVSQRLQGAALSDEVVGRLGGDEFIVACLGPDICQDTQPDRLAFQQRLAQVLKGKYDLHSCFINYPGASVGVIAVDPAFSSPDMAVRDADAAMYEEKRQRKLASVQ